MKKVKEIRRIKKAFSIAAITVCTALLSTQSFAVQKPLKLANDGRLEVVSYSPNNVVPIQGSTFITTQITFGKDEYIEDVQNGDLGAWTASISKTLPNMMFIKPTAYGSDTNMTVVTNKHTYYFHLRSNVKSKTNQNLSHHRQATYAVRFIYPQAQKLQLQQMRNYRQQQQKALLSAFNNPQRYNWDYSFHGNRTIVPLHVFDDGKFTYMQLQPNQPVPAVFAVNNPKGRESVVNYRQDGQYLVIQRVAPQFTLRVGKSEVASIFNNKQIAKLRRHHI